MCYCEDGEVREQFLRVGFSLATTREAENQLKFLNLHVSIALLGAILLAGKLAFESIHNLKMLLSRIFNFYFYVFGCVTALDDLDLTL